MAEIEQNFFKMLRNREEFSIRQNFKNNLTDVEIPSKNYDNISSTVFGSSASDSKTTLCSQQFRNRDEDVDYTQTPLYKAFTPLIVSLKLVGMHHTRRKSNSGKYFAVPTVSQIYSWFLTIIAWAMAIRVAVTLRLFSSPSQDMLSVLMFLTWMILCALNATCFLNASCNPESIMEYFIGFIKLNKFGGSYVCPNTVKKIYPSRHYSYLDRCLRQHYCIRLHNKHNAVV